MSVSITELVRYLEDCLQPHQYQDYCPNGLQVEGRPEVARIATGVTACQQLLEEAIAWGADAILVHHGYFWKGEVQSVVGMKRRRLAALLLNDINLLAYHLPLDGHPELGNNARLGQLMGIAPDRYEPLQPAVPGTVGNVADLALPVASAAFVASLEVQLDRTALHVGDGAALVQRVAWCTGGAQGYIEAAVEARADMFVTGEASEQTVHIAREHGIHFVAAGHHATERYGVQALGEHLEQKFSLQHRFIDIDNPV